MDCTCSRIRRACPLYCVLCMLLCTVGMRRVCAWRSRSTYTTVPHNISLLPETAELRSDTCSTITPFGPSTGRIFMGLCALPISIEERESVCVWGGGGVTLLSSQFFGSLLTTPYFGPYYCISISCPMYTVH